ncbi:MAG: hypothetical protein LKI85_03755 [Enterobacter sp.]|nr:hypothetical protein [Enterobacter sp.]
MRNRQLLGKWFLIMACLAMALCLVQRSVYLHHFLQGVGESVQTSIPVNVTNPGLDENQPGPSPCQLSGHSLLCAQPLFFDGALPAIILFLALLTQFTQVRISRFRDKPILVPPHRIHLINCVFRE